MFNSECLKEHHQYFLQSLDFVDHAGIMRGYIDSNQQINVLMHEIPALKECLLDVDLEYFIQIDEMNMHFCDLEKTNQILYGNISKPDAWHLDQADLQKDNNYSYINECDHCNPAIFDLDTGINYKHLEFKPGQVIDVDPSFNINNLSNPHGTGTASIIGGLNYGVSKGFKIYNYPVCRYGGGCGSSDIDKGLNYVLNYLKNNKGKRAVINMSLGSYVGPSLRNSSLGIYYNGLFKSLVDNGAIVVVAAGNSNVDACDCLFSFSDFVLAIGSVDKNYVKSSFSNYGSCVDLWSFGSDVPMAYSISDPSVIQYKSGTSFSSPMVAGMVTNLLNANSSLQFADIVPILQAQINNMSIAKYQC